MLIAFETKSSEALEKYLEEYKNPETMQPSFKNILALWMYGLYFERKVYRVDDVVVFSQKGYIEQVMKYALILLVAGAFISLFLNIGLALNISLFLMIPCMLFISPKYHLLAKIRKIKRRGHKEKIGLVSKDYLIQKLIYEKEHGTARRV